MTPDVKAAVLMCAEAAQPLRLAEEVMGWVELGTPTVYAQGTDPNRVGTLVQVMSSSVEGFSPVIMRGEVDEEGISDEL